MCQFTHDQNDTTMHKNSMNLVNVSVVTNINKTIEISLDLNLISKFYTMCATSVNGPNDYWMDNSNTVTLKGRLQR